MIIVINDVDTIKSTSCCKVTPTFVQFLKEFLQEHMQLLASFLLFRKLKRDVVWSLQLAPRTISPLVVPVMKTSKVNSTKFRSLCWTNWNLLTLSKVKWDTLFDRSSGSLVRWFVISVRIWREITKLTPSFTTAEYNYIEEIHWSNSLEE
jgi:hypothetical protein